MAETTNVEPMIITRELNAPRELVWKAWTERERMNQGWAGPFEQLDACLAEEQN